jgi:hypothetical protein
MQQTEEAQSLKILNIFDVSGVLWPHTLTKFGASRIVRGVCVGGLHRLSEYISTCMRDGEDILLAFDSETNRREVYPAYKASSVPNSAVIVQAKILLDNLPGMGIPYHKINGLEADDICHYVVKANYDTYDLIRMWSNDNDWCGNLDSHNRVSRVSVTRTGINVQCSTFSTNILRGRGLSFNAILPYKVFFRDESDNIGTFEPVAISKNRSELLTDFVAFGREILGDNAHLSSKWTFGQWIVANREMLGEANTRELLVRGYAVYPLDLPTGYSLESFKMPEKYELNMENVGKFFSMLSAYDSLKYARLPKAEITDRMSAYMSKQAETLRDGSAAITGGAPLPSSMLAQKTNSFSEDIDWE